VRIGVISDTHGWLHPGVHDVFEGVDAILHAGDVGSAVVLDELSAIAPVTAVRGNMDGSDLRGALAPLANVALAGTRVLVLHRPQDVPRPLPAGVGVVVTGHTHAERIERDGAGVLHVNPGSATQASHRTVALLYLENGGAEASVVSLD
jgi:putative phosphoesterase